MSTARSLLCPGPASATAVESKLLHHPIGVMQACGSRFRLICVGVNWRVDMTRERRNESTSTGAISRETEATREALALPLAEWKLGP